MSTPEQGAELERLRGEVTAAIEWIDKNTPQPPLAPGAIVRVMSGLLRDERALRARVAELEAQRERRRGRLVALQSDALNMRGSLSPNGEDRKVPFELGETLAPAVDWLIGRVAELESTVAAMHAAAVGEVKAPELGLVEDVRVVRASFLAQKSRADVLDGIARRARVQAGELFLAEYDGVPPELHTTVEAARDMCDDIAKVDAHGRYWDWTVQDGVHVQVWTHPDNDRPLSATSGVVTPIEVQAAVARSPYVSTVLPARDAVCGCGHTGLDHHHAGTKCWANLPKGHGEPVKVCSCAAFSEAPTVVVVAPHRGALAEQRHLVDPLDHTLELLPVRRAVPLAEMQRMSGDPIGDTPGGAK